MKFCEVIKAHRLALLAKCRRYFFSDLFHFFLVLDGPIPGQLNPFFTYTPCFYRISFNVSLPSGLVPLNLRGLSPQANYTDRAIAACRRS
jgi:hypothetical protein